MGTINDYHILQSRFLNGAFVPYTLKSLLESIYESGEGIESFQDPKTGGIHIPINDRGISDRVICESCKSNESDQSSDSIVDIKVHNGVHRHERTS